MEKGMVVAELDKGIMKELGLQGDRAVYRNPDFINHIGKHWANFEKHGSQLWKIVKEPHWYGNTKGVKGQFLFIRRIGSDYVCVAIHDKGNHLSIRSFYKKDDPHVVKRWLRKRKIRPFNRNQAPD